MKEVPVVNIQEFHHEGHDFYVNRLSEHLSRHHFIHHPHKHDFYLCVLFVKGNGEHEIDFKTFNVSPGAVFFLKPGQMHHWKLSRDCEGYILFHSREFYDLNYQARQVDDFSFFNSIYNAPLLKSSLKNFQEVIQLFGMMMAEAVLNMPLKKSKLCALVDALYINLSRFYTPEKEQQDGNQGYLLKFRKLERLIERHYKEYKSPAAYADLLNVTGKHLNRIVSTTLDKTVSEMIADRVILEAKRMLVHATLSVSQVADELGYADHSYFNRFFKKHTGTSPLKFSERYRKNA